MISSGRQVRRPELARRRVTVVQDGFAREPPSEGIDELGYCQTRVADQATQESSLELAMVGNGQRLALTRHIPKSKVATALADDLVSEASKRSGRLPAGHRG